MTVLTVSDEVAIPEAELVMRFVRAPGPGGQNVNKVATAVELRYDIKGSRALPEPVRERLLARRDRRITADGVLVLSAHRHRTQERNREDARERLAELVRGCLRAPKKRVATRPTRASKERRLAGKQHRAKVKRARKGGWDGD